VLGGGLIGSALVRPMEIPVPAPVAPERQRWVDRLSAGLRKTGSNISQVFTGGTRSTMPCTRSSSRRC
jgi:fused signal recognition particle receptor